MKQLPLNRFCQTLGQLSQLRDMTEDERIASASRRIQKKVSQGLHKRLNAAGIKAQLKGAVNEKLQAVIKIPKGLWLLVDMDLIEPDFMISEDQEGNCILYCYDNNERLLLKEIKGITAD